MLHTLPGLIDHHHHGAYGWDWSCTHTEQIKLLLTKLHKDGYDGLWPTFITQSWRDLCAHLKNNWLPYLQQPQFPQSTRVLGFHWEGPFLNPLKAGAHNAHMLQVPTAGEWREFLKETQKLRELFARHSLIPVQWAITVAPEVLSPQQIKQLKKNEWLVWLGHSQANAKQTWAAIDLGCNHLTHCFNALGASNGKGLWHHRESSLVSIALQNDELSLDFICDSAHLAPHAIQLLVRQKKINQRMIISDACPFSGRQSVRVAAPHFRPWFQQHWGTSKVLIKDVGAYNLQNILMGSVATFEQRLNYFVKSSGLSERESIRQFKTMACHNSLRFAGHAKKISRQTRSIAVVSPPVS